jgi:hypothetical protein
MKPEVRAVIFTVNAADCGSFKIRSQITNLKSYSHVRAGQKTRKGRPEVSIANVQVIPVFQNRSQSPVLGVNRLSPI